MMLDDLADFVQSDVAVTILRSSHKFVDPRGHDAQLAARVGREHSGDTDGASCARIHDKPGDELRGKHDRVRRIGIDWN